MKQPLPIDAALPDLLKALAASGAAVLEAPPGAGKTTRVPLALLDAGQTGRIVLLEPRRIAARAAAERMAETLGEAVGHTVGYRIRGETRVSPETRIEVVTEGILTRMLQSDPGLAGIGCVIFDEFHERSLNADLGLALCLEVREALRDDLVILVMSATFDGGAVAQMIGAPLVRSEGRAFPVETRWLDRPLPAGARLETEMAALITRAVAEEPGGVLAFLPGEGEIRRVAGLLDLPGDTALHPLYGALPFKAQRAALRPPATGRKVVLATSIAETSLTIEDVRVVVDAGLARRARFDPGTAMSRLVTERASRAEAEQRRGRAGRVAPGVCYRLWTKGQEGAMPAAAPAEIELADLTGLALDLAVWGARDAGDLRFLTPPNPGALAEARALLHDLGALRDGAVTDHGRAMAALPLHPRLAHMLATAGAPVAALAALLSDRDPLRGASVDMGARLRALSSGDTRATPGALERIRAETKRLKRLAPASGRTFGPAQAAALAYPDRIGLRRPGDDPRWLLSGGSGVRMGPDDDLAAARLIVVTDTDGAPRDAIVRGALAITEAELREVAADRIAWADTCAWSKRGRRVAARRQERLGAIVLDDRTWPDAPDEAVARAMLDGVREIGLSLSGAAARLRARVELVRATGANLPDMSDAGLMAALEDWLLPHLGGVRTQGAFRAMDLLPALRARLDWAQMQLVDESAPAHLVTPLGRKVPLDYSEEVPTAEVRLQEMFGLTTHPTVAGQPVRLSLLSPAGRPVQVTRDLPGFWATSYADVRRDMRGRYPRHPWPENPATAAPTTRAKPRH